jgi:formylglycine-generating enzyme required for sulfatase activity
MLPVPGGEIELPDPANPGKSIKTVIKPFYASKTEVGWNIYDVYAYKLDLTDEQRAKNVDAETRPSKPYGAPDRGFGHQGYPAISMHYKSAEHFCRWLSAKTGKKYRLPTEAEWVYLAKAGKDAVPSKDDLESVAWYWDNADDKTHPVGEKKPNAWGFLDTLGNVAEWIQSPDGKWAAAGGAFSNKADKINYAFRDTYKVEWQANDAHTPKSKWWLSDVTWIGIRLICDP